MRVVGLHHANLVVRDLDAVREFYGGLLGLQVRTEFEIAETELARGLGVEGAVLRVIFWDVPGTRAFIEMVEYATPPTVDSPSTRPADALGYGHLALAVTDLDAIYHKLVGSAVTFVSDPVTLTDGTRFCFSRDPEGNIVELIEADGE